MVEMNKHDTAFSLTESIAREYQTLSITDLTNTLLMYLALLTGDLNEQRALEEYALMKPALFRLHQEDPVSFTAVAKKLKKLFGFPITSINRDMGKMEEGEARHTRAAAACGAQGQVQGLPTIDAGNLNLPQVAQEAWAALQCANTPPCLFRYGGSPTRIETGDQGRPIARLLTDNRLRYVLARAAWWFRNIDGGGFHDALPPLHVVKDMLARPDPPLPMLERIVQAPVFALDGTLLTTPGYHPASCTFLHLPPGCSFPAVSDAPMQAEIDRARVLIVEELLGDFPFIADAERAHAVALLLLPFVRSLIRSPTPLHLVEKNSPGTGAGLLVEVLTFPATGYPLAAMTEGRDEDEWRKRITAKLKSSPAVVLIDNLRRKLESAAVSAAITATCWEDRLLGHSETVSLPVQCVWVATGNNPVLSDEVTRRTIRIRMDAKMEEPWLRPPEKFRHPNLRQWTAEHRSELVWAALTLGRAWIAADKPRGEKTLGMFEDWAEVMGGILHVARIPGFLANLPDFYRHSNEDRTLWRSFLTAWWRRFRDKAVGVSDLFPVATAIDPPLDLGDGSERSQKTRFGKFLGPMRDRQFRVVAGENGQERPESVCLVAAGSEKGAQLWRLVPVNQPPADNDQPPGGTDQPPGGEHSEPDEHVSPAPVSAQKEKNSTQEKGSEGEGAGKRSPRSSCSPEAPEDSAPEEEWEEIDL